MSVEGRTDERTVCKTIETGERGKDEKRSERSSVERRSRGNSKQRKMVGKRRRDRENVRYEVARSRCLLPKKLLFGATRNSFSLPSSEIRVCNSDKIRHGPIKMAKIFN